MTGKVAWNRGLTKDCNSVIAKYAEKVSLANRGRKPSPKSVAGMQSLHNAAIRHQLGGHTSKHRIVYNGALLQSSYERIVAEDLDRNQIKWTRPEPLLWKDWSGVDHRYYPDFFLPDYNIYLDPKNDFLIKKDHLKLAEVALQNNVTILVLNKSELSWESIQRKIGVHNNG